MGLKINTEKKTKTIAIDNGNTQMVTIVGAQKIEKVEI